MTETIQDINIEELLAPFEDSNDGNQHFRHIVNPPANIHIWQPGMDMTEVVTLARMNELELTALCGYRWVPKRNPMNYPPCETCVDKAAELMRS